MDKKITYKVFLSLLLICLSHINHAMVKDTLSIKNYEHIQDSVTYNTQLEELRFKLFQQRSHQISIEEMDKIILLGQQLKANVGTALCYRIKAVLYYRVTDYIKAIQNFEKAIELYKKCGLQRNVGLIYSEMYSVESTRGNFKKGLDYLLEGIEQTNPNDGVTMSSLYNNMGVLHLNLGDHKSAETAFLKSVSYGTKKSTLSLANLANIYILDKEYVKAKKVIEKSIFDSKKFEVPRILAISYFMSAELYAATEDYEKAKVYADSVLQIASPDKYKYVYYRTQGVLGDIAMGYGNYFKAQKKLQKEYTYFKKMNSKRDLTRNYLRFSELDSVQGNLVGALSWLKKSQKISDQRMAETSAKQIQSIKENYHAELEQLHAIRVREKEERLNEKQIFRAQLFNFIGFGGLLISLLILYSFVRARKKRKLLITGLRNSNQIKNKLFSIISHDLKNEIHGLEASLNLMKDNKLSVIEFQEILPLLVQRTNQTSILLNNLLNWSKSQMNELNANPVDFDVTELITRKFAFFGPKATQKNIQLINKLNETTIHADKDMVGIVAQNLIANAIKFCEPGDSISLFSRDKENYYEIGFTDTGVGIAPDNLSRLFAEETFTTRGTQNESGTGLGLRICKELIELNQGNIKVESTLGEGTTFFIILPKAAA